MSSIERPGRGSRQIVTYTVIYLISTGVVIGCSGSTGEWEPALSPLKTRWAADVSPRRSLPEYPRPQMVRRNWISLNGLWDLAVTGRDTGQPVEYGERVLVPFPVESALSGIGRRINENNRLWYRRTFKVPGRWLRGRILLHFGAVDWESAVYVNGTEAGLHRGGYDSFTYDITDLLTDEPEQELVVAVWDPSDQDGQPVGKQHARPGGIFYTPSSGIWQTVWVEPVPETYVRSIRMVPDLESGTLEVTVDAAGSVGSDEITVYARAGGREVGRSMGPADSGIKLALEEIHPWSPEDPFLYRLRIDLTSNNSITDRVESYFAVREISLGKDEKGITRLFLNNEPLFQLGPLDQGFWPDGLYTAPTDEALRYDIDVMKQMGFNMVRKHVKVEPDRWYYWCDRLGLMVWQDMPNGKNRNDQEKHQFEQELERVITQLFNHPSIIMWVPFNEGWGQYDAPRITEWIRELDPFRLVNHASGWSDRGVSDVKDIHSYPNPRSPEPEPTRAAVLGEFGGLGYNMPGHAWNPEGWGYDLLQDIEGLARRYEDLFLRLHPLIHTPGLSAAVYTQITDIESENNGLMTYDREIIKIPAETVRLAGEGYLPPQLDGRARIFVDKMEIRLRNPREDGIVRYTLDGNEPTEDVAQYTGPVSINETTTVKARTFWENGIESRTSVFEIVRVEPLEAMTVTGLKTGLRTEYFEGTWDLLPEFSELTPISTSIRNRIDLSASTRERRFGLRFSGMITVPETGVYIFTLSSDDGSRLFIGGEQILDNDGIHGDREEWGAVGLEKGSHPITVLFFQKDGGRGLRAFWEGPGIPRQEISTDVLHYR